MASSSPAAPAEILTMMPDCTIRSIDAAYAMLRRVTSPAAAVRVDCSHVEQADIAFVQLMVSAKVTFAARGIPFALDPVPACVCSAFTRSGIPLPDAGQSLSS